MQLCISLPAVLLWGQPHEPKKQETQEELIDEQTEEKKVEEKDDYNMFKDIAFWAWLFGTTFWSLGWLQKYVLSTHLPSNKTFQIS